jgi:hypothetical protein
VKCGKQQNMRETQRIVIQVIENDTLFPTLIVNHMLFNIENEYSPLETELRSPVQLGPSGA